ncbi:MAG: rRNA maturation RNase YbeY [Proteobacteria bacterium]|nr:rRNA maturation RNase YbeY [Pseudomonadota bacterium]MDE3207233.1 rRNA maturation RNase YbeY [Pseudomonadota bacterium]
MLMPSTLAKLVDDHVNMNQLSVTVQYAVEGRFMPDRATIRRWIKAAMEAPMELTLRIVDEPEGRELNRFRNRHTATNVLTFVYSSAAPFIGDLVLCAPVVEKEAREQGKLLTHHYAHLVVHGVLHLQGYDHETDAEAVIMENRECAILERLHIPNPYVKDGF